MRGVDVCVAIGRDDQKPRIGAVTHDVAEHEQRRAGRPLQIVEHEHDGLRVGAAAEPRHHRIEEPVLVRLRVGPCR